MNFRPPPRRLFGLPDAEHLYDEAATVWETDIEPCIEPGSGQAVVHEWTVHDPIEHLPNPDHVIDFIYEVACDTGEVAEDWGEDFPLGDDVVRSATETLLRVIANRIHYRMAKDKVAEHVIEWDATEDDVTVTLDGEPMYVPSKETGL